MNSADKAKVSSDIKIEIIKTIKESNSITSKIIFKNNTDEYIKFIRIEARFYDKDKKLIDLGKDKIWVKTPPNSESVEILNFNELDTDNIKSYGLHISEYETD